MKIVKKWVVLRRISQTIFILLFVYLFWAVAGLSENKISPEFFFLTDPNIVIFTSISERVILPGFTAVLSMLALTLILGRFFCGWVCPLGTLSDWFNSFRKRIKNFKASTNKKIRKFKYWIIGIIFLSALLGIQIAWMMDPLVITARFVSLNFIPTVTLAIDQCFIFLIKKFDLYGSFFDFYRNLKSSILGLKTIYFQNAWHIFFYFIFILSGALIVPRIWCRMLCPLGGLYALFSKFAFLRRTYEKCIDCGICSSRCRMGAINKDGSYEKSECILCMDCVYDCPGNRTSFQWGPHKKNEKGTQGSGGISRKDFLAVLLGSVPFLGFRWRKEHGRDAQITPPIRPPGVLTEKEFTNRCVRCGNCMKVCPTNVIQPMVWDKNLETLWTPQMIYEIGYCEYNCALCGTVCPTAAIPQLPLEQKQKTKMGLASINRKTCIPWSQDENCIVCEEHCPIPEKAIKVIELRYKDKIIKKPVVSQNCCIGCGICENVCPVRPRAIVVGKLV